MENDFNNFTETELANEQCRDIDGYDGIYQVSDLGRVRSLKFGNVKVLRPTKNVYGYLRVGLFRYGKQKKVLVHRLVAQAFIPNDDESKTQINHINEIKSDNRFWNLEYCTKQYNNCYNNLYYRRKSSKQPKIKDLYDPNMSYDENLKVFKENGVECSKKVIFNLRKDLGLSRPRKKTN